MIVFTNKLYKTNCKPVWWLKKSLYLDFEQFLLLLGPSSKTPKTRKWPRAWLKARDGRDTGFAAQRSRARVLPLLNLKKKSLPFSDCDHCGYEQNLQVSGWSIPKLIRRWMLWSCDHYDIIPETNYPSTEKRLIRLECSDIHVSFPLKMVSGVMIERKTTKNEVGDHKSRTLLTYKKYLA